jgi:hypothetical protein
MIMGMSAMMRSVPIVLTVHQVALPGGAGL